jgi:hypothetical protein
MSDFPNQELTGAEQLVLVSNLASGQSTRCVMKTSIFLALLFLALIFQVRPTTHLFARGEEVAADSAAQQNKLCTVQREEMEVFASYLKEGIASPQVLVTKTVPAHADVDALNLQLAAQG